MAIHEELLVIDVAQILADELGLGIERGRPGEIDFVQVVIIGCERKLRLVILDRQRAFDDFIFVAAKGHLKQLFFNFTAAVFQRQRSELGVALFAFLASSNGGMPVFNSAPSAELFPKVRFLLIHLVRVDIDLELFTHGHAPSRHWASEGSQRGDGGKEFNY